MTRSEPPAAGQRSARWAQHAPRVPTPLLLCLCAGVVGLPFGCVTEGPPAPRPPRALPDQPGGLTAERMILSVGQFPEDSDRNGYYDTILVTVYLFSDGYAAPIDLPGAFSFDLADPADATLARWEFTRDQTAAARRGFLPGPGYLFRLNMLDAGGDVTQVTGGTLRCRFEPVHGPPIEPRSGTTVAVGPTR